MNVIKWNRIQNKKLYLLGIKNSNRENISPFYLFNIYIYIYKYIYTCTTYKVYIDKRANIYFIIV